MVFNTGAPPFAFSFASGRSLEFTGDGIINNSSNAPSFGGGGLVIFDGTGSAANARFTNSGGQVDFENSSSAGTATITTSGNGIAQFFSSSTAANATLINNGRSSASFSQTSSAGNATITNTGTSGSSVASTTFNDSSTAGNASIINNSFGETSFFTSSTAGNARIINNNNSFTIFGNSTGSDTATAGNATIINNSGGETDFNAFTTAGNSTITTKSGGFTEFFDNSTGGLARFIVNGTGELNFSFTTGPNADGQISAGSIEGSGNVFIGPNNTLSVGGNNLSTEFSGVIADNCGCSPGPGALNKVGIGTLILSGANTYTGGTTISGGTLQLGNGGTTGSILGDVVDNGVLAFNHSDTFTFGGLISGSGQVMQLGPGTLALSNANAYSGGTTVAGGALSMGADNNIGTGPLALLNGSGLSFSNSFTFTHPITVAGDPTFDTPTGITVTMAGVIADGAQPGDVVKAGGGSLVLAAANTYTGGTVVNAGILQLGAGGSLAPTGALTVNAGGTFDLNGHTQTVGDFSGAGLVKLGSGALTAGASNSTTFSGVISDTGSFTKAGSGTLTLTGTNSYTGATNVAAGSLIVNGSISSSSLLTIMNGGLVGGTGVLPSTIVGSGGTLSPGNSIGAISVAGSLTFSTASVYLVEVSPTRRRPHQRHRHRIAQGQCAGVVRARQLFAAQLHHPFCSRRTERHVRYAHPHQCSELFQHQSRLYADRRDAKSHARARQGRRSQCEPGQCRRGDRQRVQYWRRSDQRFLVSARAASGFASWRADAALWRGRDRDRTGGA